MAVRIAERSGRKASCMWMHRKEGLQRFHIESRCTAWITLAHSFPCFIEGSSQTETWWLFESGVMDMRIAQIGQRESVQARRGAGGGPGPLRFFFAGPGPQEVLQRPWGLHVRACVGVGGCAGGCVCVCALSPCWHLEVPHGDRAATSILVSDPVPEGKLQRVRFKGFPECLQSPPSESTSGGLCSSN